MNLANGMIIIPNRMNGARVEQRDACATYDENGGWGSQAEAIMIMGTVGS